MYFPDKNVNVICLEFKTQSYSSDSSFQIENILTCVSCYPGKKKKCMAIAIVLLRNTL